MWYKRGIVDMECLNYMSISPSFTFLPDVLARFVNITLQSLLSKISWNTVVDNQLHYTKLTNTSMITCSVFY